jgi:hypothetical protein
MGGVHVLGLSCPHSGTTPLCGGRGLPVREDLSGDLPVQVGASAICRRGDGAQVAACNTLNLGVEFFLLFSHQIQALPFSFPFSPR